MKVRLPWEPSLFPLTRFRVEGDSMRPTLRPGDHLVVNRAAYLLSRPRPGDLVVLRDPEEPGRVLVKRVVDRADGGSCFVVGDNPAASRDSRRLGPVSGELILGKVWFRY